MKVLIYAPVDVFYYSFYIEGFYNIFGKKNVRFSVKEFPRFSSRTLAAVVYKNGNESRIVIDALDTPRIYKKPLDWCDVYGKVNFNEKALPEENSYKILAIGPSFGIRIWSLTATLNLAVLNYFKSKGRIYNKSYFFTSYWRQLNRLPIRKYIPSQKAENNYVFFISSLWEKEEKTNMLRANFIKTCKEMKQVNFEGGFAPRSDKKELNFGEFIDKRVSPKKYLMKIKNSLVVFNTPAVQGCHGWKLPEFLALGKAIISTEIWNILPERLEDKKHLHFVSSSTSEMKKAINEIIINSQYRENLERNSREYYLKHLTPKVVITRLLQFKRN